VRELVGECELTGRRTIFTRNGRPAVVLVSHDEYLALRETIEVASDAALRAQIEEAESVPRFLGSSEEADAEEPEELRGTDFDRLRIAERVSDDWKSLSTDERALVLDALRRIDDDPIAGAPLFEPLRGIWTFRAEHLRILYRIVAEARYVFIMSIGRAAP